METTVDGNDEVGRRRERTLVLLDAENLLRWRPADAIESDYERAMTRAAVIAGLGHPSSGLASADVVVGVGNHNRTGLFAAARLLPGAALRCMGGKDGGELSLLHYASDLDAVERTYSRVVIGSGDGEFVDFALELTRRSVHSTVVAWRRKLSRRLSRAVTEVRLMDSRRVVPRSAVGTIRAA